MKIEVNKKSYPVKFGYGAIRRVVQFYGYKGPADYDKLVKKFKLDKIENPTFEQLGFFGELFKAAIENADDKVDLNFSTDDLIESIMQAPGVMQDLMSEFQSSQVQPEVNPATRKK